MLGLVVELIPDASLTFHGLWDCTIQVDWCNSLHTDPSAAFCTRTRVTSNSSLNFQDQNHRALPFLGVIVVLLSRRRRPVYKRWDCLMLLGNECTHFQLLREKTFSNLTSLKCYEHQNAGVGLIQHYHRIFQACCRKKCIVNIFLQRKLFQRKKFKRPNEFFKANQLEMRPKKNKRQNEILGPTNLEQSHISEIYPKKANLATLHQMTTNLISDWQLLDFLLSSSEFAMDTWEICLVGHKQFTHDQGWWVGAGIGVVRSRSRIPNNTGSRSPIFCPNPTPGVQLNHFLHHTLELGIPVEI